MTVNRGTVEGFIQRTRTNLELVEKTYARHSEGHVITQLVNSLLGILVYPWEHQGLNHLKNVKMSTFGLQGWPDEILKLGKSESVGEFIRHMRNAVAHGRITFSSDSRDLEKVTLTFEDRKSMNKPPYWQVSFDGKNLRQFCKQFMYLIENAVG